MTSAQRNPLAPEPGLHWSPLLDEMNSVAMLLLSDEGDILEANQGFYLLAEKDRDDQDRTDDPWALFRQPDLQELTAIPYTPGDNILYSGPLSIGDARENTYRPLRGSVYRLDERLLVVAEWDVIELERSTIAFQRGNEQLIEKLEVLEHNNHELQHLRDTLLQQMLTDPLTGIANRRHLDEFLAGELARCRRTGRPLCMVLADLDHFKAINDTHGHTVGDRVLRNFANLLNNKSRSIDLAARYGGEEFILVLPETEMHKAVMVTERIRLALARLRISPLPRVTASFGVAQWIPGESAGDLLKRADRALYRAKGLGRNRVSIDIP